MMLYLLYRRLWGYQGMSWAVSFSHTLSREFSCWASAFGVFCRYLRLFLNLRHMKLKECWIFKLFLCLWKKRIEKTYFFHEPCAPSSLPQIKKPQPMAGSSGYFQKQHLPFLSSSDLSKIQDANNPTTNSRWKNATASCLPHAYFEKRITLSRATQRRLAHATHPPLKKISLSPSHSTIDVLKVDVEGSEWEAFFEMGFDDIQTDPNGIPMHNPWPPIGQVMIELHTGEDYPQHVKNKMFDSLFSYFMIGGLVCFIKKLMRLVLGVRSMLLL